MEEKREQDKRRCWGWGVLGQFYEEYNQQQQQQHTQCCCSDCTPHGSMHRHKAVLGARQEIVRGVDSKLLLRPFSCNPHHRHHHPVHSVPKHGPCLSIVPQHKGRLQRLQSYQLAMFIDSGLECDWTWPLATLCRDGCGAAMQCAVITYSWGAGTLGVIVMVTRPQTLDHPHLHTANILLLLLRNQLKPDPIKEVPKYYRALIWVSFSYQSRTT